MRFMASVRETRREQNIRKDKKIIMETQKQKLARKRRNINPRRIKDKLKIY